jgi:hypothetical protein
VGRVPAQRRGGRIDYTVASTTSAKLLPSQIAVEPVDSGGTNVGTPAVIVSLLPAKKRRTQQS